MKILWAKAGGLVPSDIGGKIRSYHIVKELARQHEVTLFTFYAAFPNDPHDELEKVFHQSICLPLEIPERGTAGDYLNLWRGVASGLPYSVVKYCQPQVSKQLRELAQVNSIDVIVCDFVLPAALIPWDVPCPKVIFTHNVEAMIYKRHYEVATNPLWKIVYWREYRSMKRFERRQLRRADRILAVSDVDRDVFASYISDEKLDVIPTGVDIDYFRPGDESEESSTEIVFTGSMDWMPNEDGIVYFAEEILHAVRDKIPQASLTVVGRKPSERLKHLASQTPGIHVTGRVEDIRPYVRRGAVYVVPLRVGSGTRLKIFEAMAMGKAIVSTTIGAEGLPITSGKDVLLADEPKAFANAVIQLMTDHEARRRIGMAARQLVEGRYSWASVASVFGRALQRAYEQQAVKQH